MKLPVSWIFLLPITFLTAAPSSIFPGMKTVKGKEKDQAIRELMKDPFVKKLGGDSLDSYRDMMGGFCEVGQWIEKDSVRRIADTCYQCDLPDFAPETVRRFVFLFSENEPARKSEKRLKKKYPEAVYNVAKDYGHGGFQAEDPEQYAAMMDELINGSEMH